MIPPLLALGVVAGFFPRGWLVIVVVSIVWPMLLLIAGTDPSFSLVVGGSLLAAVNVIVGFVVGRAVRIALWRSVFHLS